MGEGTSEAARLEVLEDTRHSIELDGGRVPADANAVHERWAAGEISLEQMRAEIDQLYPTTVRECWEGGRGGRL